MDAYYDERIHVSQMACSQHGRRNALTASLLQMAQRSLMGMSSGARELGKVSVNEKLRIIAWRCWNQPDELSLGLGNGQSHVVDGVCGSSSRLHGWKSQDSRIATWREGSVYVRHVVRVTSMMCDAKQSCNDAGPGRRICHECIGIRLLRGV
jgi:hypothetical protein